MRIFVIPALYQIKKSEYDRKKNVQKFNSKSDRENKA